MSRKIRPGYKDAKGIIVQGFDGNGILAEGTTLPADATTGYAPGCIFLVRATAAGAAFFINDGTAASCLFKALHSKSNIVAAVTTLTVTKTLHEGKTITLNLATGFASTLPLATGSGDKYRFIIGIIPTTSSTYTIVAAGSDVFKGSVPLTKLATVYDTANTGETFASSAGTTITIGGTNSPKGGATIGDWINLEDVASGVWNVSGFLTVATTPTTPFS